MPVEVAKLVDDFNKLWPRGTDPVSKADDHIRMIKEVLQLEFELLYNKTRVFSFEAGAVVNPDCILYYEAEKAFYQWNGAYDENNEYVVYVGSTPETAGGLGGNAWTRSTGSGFMSTVLVSDTEPSTPFLNMLWWDTNSGIFFIYYNDGTSTQWVDLFGIADQSSFNSILFRSILARLAAESGYTLVDGSFQEGAVSTGFSDVVLDWNTAKFYQWYLDEIKVVPVNSSPANIGTEWIDVSLKFKRTFNTVAEMKVGITQEDIGKLVSWIGYNNIFDAGGNSGVVVSAGTGSADNGSLFDTNSGLQVKSVFRNGVDVRHFGAKRDGGIGDAHINSFAFQRAMNYIHSSGGGKITAEGEYYLDYPTYIRDNTHFDITGAHIIYVDPLYAKGRGGMVFGSSVEANRDTAWAAYISDSYPSATTRNDSFVNPAIKQYLRDNLGFVQSKNSSVYGGRIDAHFTDSSSWGGYGVNFVNALNCNAYDLSGNGWTQLIGMGSDGSPETPSNHNCHAWGLKVGSADLVHTYYAAGFISNSTSCSITDFEMTNPLTVSTEDGNVAATNYCEDCTITHINVPKLGRTTNSQCVLLNNSKGCYTNNIRVGDAKSVVSTFYTDSTFNDSAKPNIIGSDIIGDGCDTILNIGAKYAQFAGYHNANTTYDVTFLNENATNNIVGGPNNVINTPVGSRRNYFLTNTIENWEPKAKIIRPISALVNDISSISAWDTNKAVVTSTSPIKFLIGDLDVKAIIGVSLYMSYNGNAQTAGMNTVVNVRTIDGYNGNTSESPVIQATVTDTASNTVTTDKEIQLIGILCEDTNGLNSQDIEIAVNNPTANSIIKEIKIEYLG